MVLYPFEKSRLLVLYPFEKILWLFWNLNQCSLDPYTSGSNGPWFGYQNSYKNLYLKKFWSIFKFFFPIISRQYLKVSVCWCTALMAGIGLHKRVPWPDSYLTRTTALCRDSRYTLIVVKTSIMSSCYWLCENHNRIGIDKNDKEYMWNKF